MDATRWKRVRALFDDLVEEPTSTWDARLRESCADDADLREEVLRMLRADVLAQKDPSLAEDQFPVFLASAAEVQSRQQADAWIGRELGVWRILRVLGRGGMGTVYLAEREDGQFRQRAAIKLLRGGDDSPSALTRFLAERQILAELEHPHIARLFDGGRSSDGVPWFALEYVDGVSLTAWCDARNLDVRARVQLFLDVCSAVSYAHQHLVVHRDLKPANILVDADGQVKLLDFGIAKLIDDAAASNTGTGLRAFTPEYAAPEQVRGERITTATDVYALGVVLYELLTGQRPYRVADRSPRAYERAIIEQDPSRPSVAFEPHDSHAAAHTTQIVAAQRSSTVPTLRARLRGDLDAIVLKALRKEPAARYATVAEFDMDLRNALALRPVNARRGGWRYRSARFLRRNALAVILSTVAFMALAMGLIVALSQAGEARRQRDTAEREASTAREALGFMEGLFNLADPSVARGREVSARELLDEGQRRIRTALLDEPVVRARLLRAMGQAYLGLGLDAEALPLVDDALALARSHDDIDVTAAALLARADALIGLGRYQDVVDELTSARAALDVESAPQRAADFDFTLGRAAQLLGNLDTAETLYTRALAVRETQLGFTDARTQRVVTSLVSLHESRASHEQALVLAQRAADAFAGASHDNPLRADAISSLAMVLTNLERLDEAETLRREALDIYTGVYGEQHTITVRELGNLASVLFAQRNYAAARPIFEQVLAARIHLYGPDHPAVGTAQHNAAMSSLMTGDPATALLQAQEALRIRLAAFGKNHGSTLQSMLGVGSALFATGRLDESAAMLLEAIDMLRSMQGMESSQGSAYNTLTRGQLERAAVPAHCDYSAHAVELNHANPPGADPRKLYSLALDLACRVRRGDAAAVPRLKQMIAAYRAAVRADDPYLGWLEDIAKKIRPGH